MAEVGRTICVCGFPSDIDPERLADKLTIHFLRERNGGGEITSVIIKATDRLALITFEDITVALSVLRHSPHIFEVDGRKYELAVTFPWQNSVHSNKVILNMSVTIDCSQLPQGEETLKTLNEKFPGLRVHFLRQQRQCSLHGLYSEVQSVVSHLVKLLGDPEPLEEKSSSYGRDRNQGSWNNQGNLENQGEAKPADQTHRLHVGLMDSKEVRAQRSEILMCKNPCKEGTNVTQTHTTEERKEWMGELGVEDVSLIMEADVFAYLRDRSNDYKHILRSHGVNVVDVTSEGVTTLYLQADAKATSESEIEKRMKQAHKELGQLYRQVEGNLRRAQIRRSALCLRGGDTAAFKDLQLLLPKVLLTYDQTNVYIVGESSEVSQAKQILLLGSRDEHWLSSTPKNEMLCFSSPSNPDCPASQPEVTQVRGAVAPKMNISRPEQRGRGREEYKLAARFKKSEKGFLGFGPGENRRGRELQDFTTDMSMLTLASNVGPAPLGRSSLGTPGTVNDEKAGAPHISAPQKVGHLTFANTFKTCEPFSDKVYRTYSTGSTSTLTPAVKAPPITSVNALSGLDKKAKAPVLAISGTLSTPRPSLRRANSFSGRPSQKQEMQKTGINEKSSHSLKRPKSSSFKSDEQSDENSHGIVSTDVIVSTVMWSYMKEAYQSRLAALISDLQLSEIPEGKDEVRVNLKGSDVSKVGHCQRELQKLVGLIASDFCVQELRLSDLGVTEDSEVFEACCSNIRSRFGKISLYNVKDGVLLIGPRLLCSNVTEMLKEVFPNVVSNSAPQISTFTHQGTTDQHLANASDNETLFQSNGHVRPSHITVDAECCQGYGTYQTGEYRGSEAEPWNVSPGIQSPKKNPVVKEKLKKGGPADLEAGKIDMFTSQSSVVSSSPPSLTTQKKQKAFSVTSKPSILPVGKHSECYICGDRGVHIGHDLFLCHRCLPLHSPTEKIPKESSQDMWAHQLKQPYTAEKLIRKEADKGPGQLQGIRGTMKCIEVPQSLSGYEPHPTAKITYNIPDGIQGEEHPNPGSPFKGGIFDAYLPLSPKGRSLLSYLEKAFEKGLTFTICPVDIQGNRNARIIWDRIPHKINMEGGRSGNGYPDSAYLNDLAEALKASSIEESSLNEN